MCFNFVVASLLNDQMCVAKHKSFTGRHANIELDLLIETFVAFLFLWFWCHFKVIIVPGGDWHEASYGVLGNEQMILEMNKSKSKQMGLPIGERLRPVSRL